MFNTNKIQSLQKKSQSAVKVVRDMLANLETANKEVRFTKGKKLEKKAILDAELKELDTIEQQNEKFMAKFNSLFED